MNIFQDLLQSASEGILSIYAAPISLLGFTFFLIWASYKDLKTMKIKNYQNLSFFLTGLILFIMSQFKIPYVGFELGPSHFYGALVGFFLLFIPGMILNYAFGGDIKFSTVMGFWVGPTAILLILIIAVLLQFSILVIRAFVTKNFSMKNNFPFAPALSLSYFLSLAILLIL